jgi:hypothetical protein
MQAGYDYLAENPGAYDPPAQMARQHHAVVDMAKDHIRMLGSDGKAW